MSQVTKEQEEARALFLHFLSHCKNKLTVEQCIEELTLARHQLNESINKRIDLLAAEEPDLYQIF